MNLTIRRYRPAAAFAIALVLITAFFVTAPPAHAAPTLLSQGKPVTSSGVGASLANDADPSNGGGYFDAQLAGGKDAWWQVDLQGFYDLSTIVNRNYYDGTRYYHYYVRVSLDGENWSAPIAWKYNNNPALDAGETFSVTGVARYVRVNIIKNSANTSAHLTNFEVWGEPQSQPLAPVVAVSDVATDAETYVAPEVPEITYTLTNTTSSPVTVAHAYAIVFGLSDRTYRRFTELESGLTLPANATHADTAALWAVDGGMPAGAYGVFLRTELADGSTWERFETFFRVVAPGQLTVFDIAADEYSGFPVYTLDGGLSAEYAVLKSAQVLSQSAGPSWTPSQAGYGPKPVYATPGFVEKTINEAITTLDAALGSTRQFDTVLLAPGIQSTPQLIFTLQAPVLPLHFLVSFDSVYELRTVLDEAAEAGYDVMATMGFDGSMDPGVAWIKFLTPPAEYLDFIDRHGAHDVVIAGSNGDEGGENAARRVTLSGAPSTGHNPGDIFVIYPGGGSATDVRELAKRVPDVSDLPLAAQENISDWEAGVLPEQTTAFTTAIAPEITGKVAGFGAPTYYDIDNIGIYVTAAHYKKNETALAVGGEVVRGIALSPYMTNQPFADATDGILPVLFFQGESSLTIVEGRILNRAAAALAKYFPAVDVTDLHVDVITSRNFGGFANDGIDSRLTEFGFTSRELGNKNIDEVWNPSTIDAWNEKAVVGLASERTQGQWTTWNSALSPLGLDDLYDISCSFQNIHFTAAGFAPCPALLP